MPSRSRVCLVIPSLNAGGMERVMTELANFFASMNLVETHLIILGRGNKFYEVSKNVIIHEPDFYFNNKYRAYYMLKTVFFLRSRVKAIDPYSILSFGEMYNSFVILASFFLDVKVYVSDRSRPNKSWGFFHNSLRRILYKRAFGIISQTSYSKLYLEKITKHKNIKIVPNPVRKRHIEGLDKQNIILTVGRLIHSKRLDLLLGIFAETEISDYSLWVVGDGPELQNLKRLSCDLQIESRVVFWGNRKDVEIFYMQSKIFAFTSSSEGFPNAILEALSFGLPTIAFDCIAGPSDLIEDGQNGFLIPELEVSLYKSKLRDLLNEPLRVRMAKYALVSAKKYDIVTVGNVYLNTLLS